MQRNQQIVGHVPQRMGARNIQRVPVMDDALFVVLRLFQSPLVRDGVITIVEDYGGLSGGLNFFCRCVWPGATDHPTALAGPLS